MKEYKNRIEITGPDGWCFGSNFWLQAALFERTGCADWEIIYGKAQGQFRVRRAVSIQRDRIGYQTFEGGQVKVHADDGYSLKGMFEAMKRAVAAMTPGDEEDTTPGCGNDWFNRKGQIA